MVVSDVPMLTRVEICTAHCALFLFNTGCPPSFCYVNFSKSKKQFDNFFPDLSIDSSGLLFLMIKE